MPRIPNKENLKPRIPGYWKDKVIIHGDFDDANIEISKLFYGNDNIQDKGKKFDGD